MKIQIILLISLAVLLSSIQAQGTVSQWKEQKCRVDNQKLYDPNPKLDTCDTYCKSKKANSGVCAIHNGVGECKCEYVIRVG